MRAGLTPSTLQWCRCGRFRGRNLAESVAVRRRFRAGVRVFCQTLPTMAKTFAVRSNAVGVAGKIAQCVGVRLPNTVRQVDVEKEVTDPSP